MLSDTKVTHRYIGTALEARGFHFEQKLNLLSRHSFSFPFPLIIFLLCQKVTALPPPLRSTAGFISLS